MNIEIQRLWDVYSVRKTMLLSGFVCIATKHGTSGQGSNTWESENVHNLIAGLVLMDLTSVLDEALKVQVTKDGKLYDRLLRADSKGILKNYLMLEELRKRRNDVAHEMLATSLLDLNKYHCEVMNQLVLWDYINVKSVLASIDHPSEWQRDRLTAQRIIEIGVIEERTHDRIWGWDICQSVTLCQPDASIDSAEQGASYETKPKFYA
jgi:hypothetical protein